MNQQTRTYQPNAPVRYKNIHPLSWEELHRDVRTLAWKLAQIKKWKGLVAVTRGGLVPAAIIARELEIRLIETICLASYEWQRQNELQVLKSIGQNLDPDWLIIDDLVDSGQTAQVIKNMFPENFLATIYAKPKGKTLVDLFVREVSQDTWILFPWDSELMINDPIVKQTSGIGNTTPGKQS